MDTTKTTRNGQEDIREIITSLIYKQPTKVNKHREMIRHLDRVIENHPTNIEFLFAKGFTLCKMGRYSSSLEYFDRCIKIYNIKPSKKIAEEDAERINRIGKHALFYKGYALKEMERFGDAKTVLECYFKDVKSAKENQFYLQARANQMYVLKELGKTEDAIKCIEKIEKNNVCKKCRNNKRGHSSCKNKEKYKICQNSPQYEYILYYKAYSFHEKCILNDNTEDAEDAKVAIEQCIDLNKSLNGKVLKNEYAVYKRYQILSKRSPEESSKWLVDHSKESVRYTGEAIESLKFFDSLKKNRTCIDFLNEGNNSRLFGNNLAAIRYFDNCLKDDQFNFYAYYYKGCALNSLGRYEHALRCFNIALNLAPGDPDVQFNMGNTCRRLGQYKQAIEHFDQSLKFNEFDKDALMYKGSVLNESNEYGDAIKCFEKIEEYNKKFKIVYHNIEGYEDLYSKNEYVYHSIGFAKMGQKKYAQAVRQFIECLTINETNEYALLNLAYSISKLNEYIDEIDEESLSSFDKIEETSKRKKFNFGEIRDICKCEFDSAIALYNSAIELEKKASLSNIIQENEEELRQLYDLIEKEKYDAFNIKIKEIKDEEHLAKKYWEWRKKKYTYAQGLLDEYIKLNPMNEEAYFYQCSICIKLLDYETAFQYIEKYEKSSEANKEKNKFKEKSKELNKDAILIKIFLLGMLEHNITAQSKKDIDQITNIDIIALLALFSNTNKDLEETNLIIENLLKYNDFFKYAIGKVGDEIVAFEDDYKKIYIKSLSIIQSLYVDINFENYVSQYTTKFTAENLLLKKSPFRLYSILTTNDPKEGKTLLDYLGVNDNLTETNSDYQSFVACFTFNHKSLNQYRLYGKESGKEATGVSIVFKPEFFRDRIHTTVNTMYFKYNRTLADKQALFRCIYINPENRQVVALGHRRSYTFYTDKDDIETSEPKVKKYNRRYDEKLKSVQDSIYELRKMVVNNETLNKEILSKLLLQLRFLVKHYAYEEEQECRIYDIEKMVNNSDVKTTENGQMYVDYLVTRDYVKKIYFAPKAIEMELFRDRLFQDGLDNIKCEKSNLPFR